jgi:hypothetical protein
MPTAGGPNGEALSKAIAALCKTFCISQSTANQLLEAWSCDDWQQDAFSGAA